MKKVLFMLALLFVSTATLVQAQNNKQPLSPKVTAESPNKNIKVVYGQPSKRNRQIFGALVPYGQVWRTGANEATEITFAKNMMFGDKMVKAGTYTLFTIPTEKEWTVILNSKLGEWGAYEYEKNKDKNVAEVKVPVKSGKTVMEKMTIKPTNTDVSIAWDQVMVSVPVKESSMAN